ncbi:MAG TPA: hypothetical protein DET40_03160 [Lentisphaeria bacterium]|nr:MAG: hypothetical protein A2X45_22330 [Lentisphaerae bacterium GWF2_50_93]HCE42530.1 hypothetical protein [Lentisphaeria bacterium]
MRKFSKAAMSILVLFVAATLSAQNVKRVYNDFEQYPCRLNEWNKASGSMKNSSDVPEGASSKSSMEMTANFSGKGFENFTITPLNGNVPGTFKSISLWVKNVDGKYGWFMAFKDSGTYEKGKEPKREFNFKCEPGKWTKLNFTIPADWPQPVAITGFITHNWGNDNVKADNTLRVCGMEIVSDTTTVKDPNALFTLSCSTGVEANVFNEGDPMKFSLDFDSWRGKEVKGSLSYEINDSTGGNIAKETKPLSINGSLHYEIVPQPKKYGVYEIKITVKADGMPDFQKTAHFAYLPKVQTYTEAEKMVSPFALVIHGGMTDVTYNAYAKMGFTWVRDYAYTFNWMTRAKGDNGKYEGWPWYNKMDQKLKESGLMLLPTLMGTISEGVKAGNLKMTKEVKAEIISIMGAFPQYKCWELDNEYDYGQGKEEAARNWSAYQAYHKTFGDTVKFIDENVFAVENGTAGIYPERTRDFIKAGNFNNIDVINAHFYCGTDAPELNKMNYNVGGNLVAPRSIYDTLREYVAVASCDGKKRQTWITEFGWDTLAGHIVNEYEQAAYLQRGYMLGIQAGIDKMFWYWNMDTKGKPTVFFDGCGILDPKVEPKPAVGAIAAMVHFMKLPKPVGTCDLGENAMGYVFTDSGKIVAAVFKTDGSLPDKEVEIKGGKLFDMFANPLPSNKVKLAIGPTWITGLDESSTIYKQTAYDLKSNYYNRMTAGDTFTIELRAKGNRKEAISAKFALQLPKGWTADKATGDIAVKSGETTIVPIVITADPKEQSLYQKVPLKITESGLEKTLTTEFNIVTAGMLKATPLAGLPGECKTTVTIGNNSSLPKSFIIKTEVPKSWKISPTEMEIKDMAGSKVETREFTVTWNTGWTKDEKAKIYLQLPDGRVIAETNIIPPAMALAEITKPVQFNGDLKNWPAEARLPEWMLGATASNPGTEVYAGYSKDGIYMAINVKDSKVAEEDPRSFWAQDCIELFIDSAYDRKERKEYKETDHQFWISPQTKNNGIYAGRWKRNNEIPAIMYDIKEVKGYSKKTENGYILEFLIPASLIKGFKAEKGTKIGLNFNISVTHAKRDKFEVFWATEKADKTTERPYIWGTVELK